MSWTDGRLAGLPAIQIYRLTGKTGNNISALSNLLPDQPSKMSEKTIILDFSLSMVFEY
jgi:hypothetical protein